MAIYTYIYIMQVYTKKNVNASAVEVGVCSKVVLDLLSGLENSHIEMIVVT